MVQLTGGFFVVHLLSGMFYELVFSIYCVQYCGKWRTQLARLSRKVTTIKKLFKKQQFEVLQEVACLMSRNLR